MRIILKRSMKKCIKTKRYEEAIRILEEGKLVDKEYRGLVQSFSKKLKEIYAETGQHEKYKDELWRTVLDYDAGNLDIYKELKTHYTVREWEEKRRIVRQAFEIGVGIGGIVLHSQI